ncbi:MAG TPA: DMT family transporter [Thermoleophilia bacterium]|nr:DMT family transporter [Thermoleophilia bacterium]
MFAVVLALAASLCYGGSDFLAGSQTRRTSIWTVIIFSQLTSLSLMALAVLARGQAPPREVLPLALGAGLLSAVSVATYYQALAIGVMGIIGPVCSVGTAVPVMVGLASGERPSTLQLAGIGMALGGVLLASRTKSAGEHHQATSQLSIALAVLSAMAFGFAMVFYARGAQSDPYWTVVLARSTSMTVFLLAFVVMRPGLKLTGAAAVPILAVGVLGTVGAVAFTVATTLGYLSIVSVLSSIFPVLLIILAYVFLHERLSRTQLLGVASALIGVALIAAG